MRTPIHPGELLADELQALGLSANQLATHLKAPANRVTQILKGQRTVMADTARQLAQFFGTTPQYWLNVQMFYELDRDRLLLDKEQEILSIPRYDTLASCRV